MDCIYFKINKFNTDKKLNRELGEFLGIMEPLPVKKEENKVGANVAAFVGNLIPLFAALMSAALLKEMPQIYHGIAFICIVFGILISSQKRH